MRSLKVKDHGALEKALHNLIDHSAKGRFLHRLHCVCLSGKGYSCSEVANMFGHAPSTVARWVRHYNVFGILGLQDDPHTGRPASLDVDHLRTLRRELRQPPHALGYRKSSWDGKLLSRHLKQAYDIHLGIRQCQRILSRSKDLSAVS